MTYDYAPAMSLIKQVEVASSLRPNTISLAQGTPAIDTPLPIVKAAAMALLSGKASAYTDSRGLPELRKAISSHLYERGMSYDWQNEIVVTSGASEAIVACIKAVLTNQKKEVIITSPSYAGYPAMISVAGGQAQHCPLTDGTWELNTAALEKRITANTAAILLANPNNPTGTIFSKPTLLALAKLAKKHMIMLILDEVYSDLILSDSQFYSPATDSNLKDSIIRIHSLSKTFAMTGWRIAYVHGPVEVMKRITAIHDSIATCTSAASQYACLEIFNNYSALAIPMQQFLQRQLTIASELLSDFITLSPSAAYFLFIRTPIHGNEVAADLLSNYGVAVVPGEAFGPTTKNYIRVCFGRPEADVKKGCKAINKYLKELV